MSAHHDLAVIHYVKFPQWRCSQQFWMLQRYFKTMSGGLWAVLIPQYCTCSIDGHAMIWRSSPLYSSWSKASSLWNTCWMLFCGKSHPVTECWREIHTTFPSGLRSLTILFPCQQENFVSLSFSFTWHLDEPYTARTKISLLEFNHDDKCIAKRTISEPSLNKRFTPRG